MTGVQSLFPRSSFVGFDHLFNELEHVTRHAQDHYPPHNIIRTSDTDYLIELAVAGFSRDELNIEVKDRTLTVKVNTNQRVASTFTVVFPLRSSNAPLGCPSM